MGGYGSGQWYRYGTKHDTTEGKLPLDVRILHRKGLLERGFTFTSRWWRGSDPERGSSISGVVGVHGVVLFYRHRNRDGEWEDIRQPVSLEWTRCHYGGERPWWTCPACRRRVAVLFAAGKYFACRHCYDLVYPSQNEGLRDRTLRKAQKIREKLGGSGSMVEPFPDKPKGMHWKTYRRWVERGQAADLASWGALKGELDEMDARTGRLLERMNRTGGRRD